MKIALNGQNLSSEYPAGPEKYTHNLYKALSQINSSNVFTVYSDKEGETKTNIQTKYLPKFISWTQFSLAKELLINTPDLFFTPVHTLPLIRNPRMKVVGMIHGLEFKYNTYTGLLSRLLKGKHEWYVAKFSDALIVPSEATKNEILKMNWGIPDNKIFVVNEGVGEEFYKRTSEEVNRIKNKYNLKNPYLIFISTIQPRKNLPKLVEAFSKAVKEPDALELDLVIIGKNGWSFEESLESPKKFNVGDRVKFLGRVPDEDLPALISGAQAYISPSLEEGFGLPLLEAMACEIPCLVSDIPAYKEIAADTVIYFDPVNPEDIRDKIECFLKEIGSSERIAKAKERAKHFTWKKAAEETWKIFQKTLNP